MAFAPADFVNEAWAELKKVTWLTKDQVVKSTIAVVVLVILVSIYISGVDFVLSIFLRAILGAR